MNWKLDKFSHLFLLAAAHGALFYIFVVGNFQQITTIFILHFLSFWITGTVTYHRLLSHRSWKSPRWFEIFASLWGVFSFTGSSITRTIIHRLHHATADTPDDPHSPWHKSIFKLYLPMLFYREKLDVKWATDLAKDPLHLFIHRKYLLIILVVFSLSYLFFGLYWALSLVVAPGALSWLTIYLGNILCHLNATADEKGNRSLNNWFIVIIGFGEGWHDYHHRNVTDPDFGHGLWDPGWWLIKLLRKD